MKDVPGGGQEVEVHLVSRLRTLELIGRHRDVQAWKDKVEEEAAADIVDRLRGARQAYRVRLAAAADDEQ